MKKSYFYANVFHRQISEGHSFIPILKQKYLIRKIGYSSLLKYSSVYAINMKINRTTYDPFICQKSDFFQKHTSIL